MRQLPRQIRQLRFDVLKHTDALYRQLPGNQPKPAACHSRLIPNPNLNSVLGIAFSPNHHNFMGPFGIQIAV
jgi:hypothetical protein